MKQSFYKMKENTKTRIDLLTASVMCCRGTSKSEIGTAVDFTGKCGCICQFQVNINHEGTIISATAVTKKLLLGLNGLPQYTPKGRLLLTHCPCNVNSMLSSAVANSCVGKPFDYISNEICSPVAPLESQRTLTRRLGLQPSKIHCLRLVERAAIAAFQGRIVHPEVQRHLQSTALWATSLPYRSGGYVADIGMSMDPDDHDHAEHSVEESQERKVDLEDYVFDAI